MPRTYRSSRRTNCSRVSLTASQACLSRNCHDNLACRLHGRLQFCSACGHVAGRSRGLMKMLMQLDTAPTSWKALPVTGRDLEGQMDAAPSLAEHQVVASVWAMIQDLLSQGEDTAQATLRSLAAMLPDLQSLGTHELPELAKLHVSSAHNLMATLRLLAPAAFACGSSQQPDLNALDDANSGLLGIAANLVELQLFHLQRAATLTTAARRRYAQQQGSRDVSVGSSCESASSGASTHFQL